MNLNAKQIARLIEHNAMLRKSGQKALSHDEVVRFFGPALQFRTSCSPKKPKKPHTIEAHHDRAHASKLGRRERIKPSRAPGRPSDYDEWARDAVKYYGKAIRPRNPGIHAKRA